MFNQKRMRDYGVKIGRLETGFYNAITDVDGVTVGHVTLSDQASQTGVKPYCLIRAIFLKKSLLHQVM